MLKIYIIRHGQDIDNLNNILNGRRNKVLTGKGVEQAENLSLRIIKSNIKFDEIYTSPLKRAVKTAEIIAKKVNGNKPELIKDLQEREFGVMTGKSLSKIEELCSPNILKTNTITYFLNPDGAETFPQLIKRANKILKYIKLRHDDGNILLVTHGDVGKMIYAAYYRINWKDVLKMFHLGNSDMILLSKDSRSESSHVFKTKQYNL